MGWEKEVEALRERQRLARQMGGPERLERQRAGGKLNVRERVEQLLDPESFIEVGSIAGKSSYDEAGNLRTSTLAEYLVPAASDVPSMITGHTYTPSPTNVLGVKGIGEAGTIGAAPAVINAIVDALAPFGVHDITMPASPQRVWQTIKEAAK